MDDYNDEEGRDEADEGDSGNEGIVIDLTHPYELDWMARGRKEKDYRAALRDYLVEDGYAADKADRVMLSGLLSGGLDIRGEEWDEIWDSEEEPAEAMLEYLGEETVEALMNDEFETLYRNRMRQKAEYRPHLKEVHPHYFSEEATDE